MTDKEKLELLLNSVFSDISFSKIQTLENGSFHLIDRTSEMWIRIEDNVAQIAFREDFEPVFERIKLSDIS
ncbi:hypothetical protein FQS90_14195 [Enterococcus casseliflavus]|jgi:hypothetical protein|uniref:hypothetical protein n=1 Tax=Enterococcus sp. 8E11_MSG4843 TaxID=1834190 RepID=UPI000B3E6D45|nr:hypothetical protein [Enterococcus sp. 8E11_MSG4843]MBO1097664.1 hypothetical protein [Enterococcus casseliflavus]MBO1144820.1 hypothetical protein [Enterococcus casseliflavus]OUZ28279.1 hypothetical protein A5885_003620 [Enterococcus sp. 8E11_MSG4843]